MVSLSLVLNLLVLSVLSGVWGQSCRDRWGNLFIDAPDRIQALTGSCVQIPCRYEAIPTKTATIGDQLFGVWIIKSSTFADAPQNVIFNGTRNLYKLEITGDLGRNICTTVIPQLQRNYTDNYFFRIESPPLFRATATCDPVSITVNDSPPTPDFKQPDDLREAEPVTLTCSASDPCPDLPPRLTWNLQGQDTQRHDTQNQNETWTKTIRATFNVTYKDNGVNISCSAEYPINDGKDFRTAKSHVVLNVSYSPKETSGSMSPSGPLSSGDRVNLTCTSRANPPVTKFVWFRKNGEEVTTLEQEGAFLQDVIIQEGEVYFCVAHNALGNQTSPEIHLTGKPLPWKLILGGVAGIVFLICLVAICCWLIRSRKLTQTRADEPLTEMTSRNKTDGEEIHYGEINFSMKKKTEEEPSSSSPKPRQDVGQTEDTVYAQVKVSTPAADHADHADHANHADHAEDVYTEVKKH